jgi:adenosylcobinamide amidohydrolase/ABC-type Fe3+-hydroxamate transport system substrate-binding protein
MSEIPRRVVCLAPYITEMLVRFGREQALAGLTRQDLVFHAGLRKSNVGGYFEPDIRAIEACRPDLIIAAPSHKEVIRHFADSRVMVMEAGTLEEAFAQMEMTGRLFDCEAQAAEVIRENREKLALVKARLAALPAHEKKRVVRVMAGDELSCPGDDSFQNEIIEAAGGTVPKWGKNGFAVPVDLKDWQGFNPQVVYGCHTNEKAVRDLLGRDGWKDVDAVRTGSVAMFPCELTCRVSTRTGDFVQWLAAVLYPDLFADPKTAVSENRVLDQKPVLLDLPYVDRAEVVRHRVADAEYKSMAVRFKTPQNVLSTLEGSRSGIKAVGNTYVPMHASLGHMDKGVDQVKTTIAENLGYATDEYAGLMTGADMDNLSVQKQTFKDLEVTALVTAGVRGNALRLSRDSGGYTKPGTINIMVLSNRRLSSGAMAWALVTITEAKTAALSDLDIRSTYTPWDHRATGTGTDTIIVVQGEGPEASYTGGHTKIGELIAKAVHAGVIEAISLQNGIRGDRDLFQKLAERKLDLEQILELFPVESGGKPPVSRLEDVLMTPYYASFLESALAVSDEYQKGLVKDLAFFDDMCASVTARLAGKTGIPPRDSAGLPIVMAKAFGALVAGITEQQN